MTDCKKHQILFQGFNAGKGIAAGLIFLAVLFFLDIATTQFILSNGGYELNLLMKGIVNSELFHAGVKTVVFALITTAVLYCNSRIKNSGTFALFAIIGWYLIVAIHNLGSIAGMI
jgi:hypothetical protein